MEEKETKLRTGHSLSFGEAFPPWDRLLVRAPTIKYQSTGIHTYIPNYSVYNTQFSLYTKAYTTMFQSPSLRRLPAGLNSRSLSLFRSNSTAAGPATPPLLAKIRNDLKIAMRAKDKARYSRVPQLPNVVGRFVPIANCLLRD